MKNKPENSYVGCKFKVRQSFLCYKFFQIYLYFFFHSAPSFRDSGDNISVTRAEHLERKSPPQIKPQSKGGTTVIRRDFSNYPEAQSYPIVYSGKFESGTNGRTIELLANFMLINVHPTIVFQYDVDFKFKNSERQKTISADENERIQRFFAKHAPKLVDRFVNVNQNVFTGIKHIYDNGKNIYATEDIDSSILVKNIDAEIDGRKKEFIVEFSKVQIIDLSTIIGFYSGKISNIPEVAISFLEVLFQNICLNKFQLHRRNLYDVENGQTSGPNSWLRFVQGFTTAVHRTQIGPSLNLHLKTSCLISFSTESLVQLVEMISDCRNIRNLSSNDLDRVNKIIRGLEVYSTHMGRKMTYKIKALVSKKPREVTFMFRERNNGNGDDNNNDHERLISVYDYFMMKYQMELEDYPTVQMMGRSNFFMPLEILHMVDKQFLNQSKIDPLIQNDLLHASTHKPLVYFNHLSRFATEIAQLDTDKMNHFGANFSPKPVRLNGRVLDPPHLIGGGRNDRFASTVGSKQWAFFSFDEKFDKRDVANIVSELKQTGHRFGLDLSKCVETQVVPIDNRSLNVVKNVFANILKLLPDVNLLFILLPQSKCVFDKLIMNDSYIFFFVPIL